MNAYELADELEAGKNFWIADEIAREWVTTTLRQQADEVVQLKLEWQIMYDRVEFLERQLYGSR